MAKDLPYFKFTVAEWLTGDIVFESFEMQGLFINICALYWQRECKLSLSDIDKRYKRPDLLNELTDRFISVNNGFISVKFLDEQFEFRKGVSIKNSKNGSLGGRPKHLQTLEEKPNANRTLTEHKAKDTNIDKKREEKKREDIDSRKQKFASTLTPFKSSYDINELMKFYEYWTEPNKSNTKFRQELEQTWDLERRLKTWFANDKIFGNNIKKAGAPPAGHV
jgi:hypothetical protein